MKHVGISNQSRRDRLYSADGTIATGGTPQLVLAQSQARSFLFLQNISSNALLFEIGSALAHATISSGVVTAITVDNAGFNFTKPPVIELVGGGSAGNSSYLGLNQPNGESPSHPAKAHCVLTGDAVSSIVVDDGGAGYVVAPFCLIYDSDLDPYGAALPSATSGILLLAQGDALVFNATCCPTDPVAVYGSTTGQPYVCRWMD
jgi:hypothetical protein